MTDTYIKMCAAATEIQELWQPKPGDWLIDKLTPDEPPQLYVGLVDMDKGNGVWHYISDSTGIARHGSFPKESYVWLPTIEDMVDLTTEVLHCTISTWEDNVVISCGGLSFSGEELEDVFLKVTMHLVYGIYWNGEEWE